MSQVHIDDGYACVGETSNLLRQQGYSQRLSLSENEDGGVLSASSPGSSMYVPLDPMEMENLRDALTLMIGRHKERNERYRATPSEPKFEETE